MSAYPKNPEYDPSSGDSSPDEITSESSCWESCSSDDQATFFVDLPDDCIECTALLMGPTSCAMLSMTCWRFCKLLKWRHIVSPARSSWNLQPSHPNLQCFLEFFLLTERELQAKCAIDPTACEELVQIYRLRQGFLDDTLQGKECAEAPPSASGPLELLAQRDVRSFSANMHGAPPYHRKYNFFFFLNTTKLNLCHLKSLTVGLSTDANIHAEELADCLVDRFPVLQSLTVLQQTQKGNADALLAVLRPALVSKVQSTWFEELHLRLLSVIDPTTTRQWGADIVSGLKHFSLHVSDSGGVRTYPPNPCECARCVDFIQLLVPEVTETHFEETDVPLKFEEDYHTTNTPIFPINNNAQLTSLDLCISEITPLQWYQLHLALMTCVQLRHLRLHVVPRSQDRVDGADVNILEQIFLDRIPHLNSFDLSLRGARGLTNRLFDVLALGLQLATSCKAVSLDLSNCSAWSAGFKNQCDRLLGLFFGLEQTGVAVQFCVENCDLDHSQPYQRLAQVASPRFKLLLGQQPERAITSRRFFQETEWKPADVWKRRLAWWEKG